MTTLRWTEHHPIGPPVHRGYVGKHHVVSIVRSLSRPGYEVRCMLPGAGTRRPDVKSVDEGKEVAEKIVSEWLDGLKFKEPSEKSGMKIWDEA